MPVEFLSDVFILFVAYQAKHFLCDFPLQTSYMLGKFKPGSGFFLPLTAHCAAHALGTFVVVFGFARYRGYSEIGMVPIMTVMLFDFVVHFVMDRIKASPKLLGRYQALSKNEYIDIARHELKHGEDPEIRRLKLSNKLFWISLGLDQMVHALTHYAIIYYILTRLYT